MRVSRYADYPQMEDGDVTRITPGKRFRFACCGDTEAGCSLVHDLIFRTADDGKIEMKGYRNESETSRLRALDAAARAEAEKFTEDGGEVLFNSDGTVLFQVLGDVGSEAVENYQLFNDSGAVFARKDNPMRTEDRRRRRALDTLNSSAFDENGILRDGHTARFPLQMRDSTSRNRRRLVTDDADRAEVARKVTEAVMRTEAMMASGDTHFSDTELRMHRPGYRLLGDDSTTTEEEHHVTHRRRKTTYRDPEGRETGSAESNDALAGLSPGERARAERMIEDSNAWKTDASQYSTALGGTTGMATRAMVAMPLGAYPLSAGEGNVCTVDGRAGYLRREGEWLVCKPEPIQATRADATSGPEVAPRRSMSAEEAQPARDAAYQEYCDEIRNAWRPPTA